MDLRDAQPLKWLGQQTVLADVLQDEAEVGGQEHHGAEVDEALRVELGRALGVDGVGVG